MNRFIEAIETKFLENVPSQRMPQLVVSVDNAGPLQYAVLGSYRLSIRWSRIIQCEPKDYDRARKNFTEELKELIFGEIRENIRHLEKALFEKRDDDAIQLLDEIRRQMYG